MTALLKRWSAGDEGVVGELRFFGGLSESEAAQVLGVSRSTLNRDWRFARLWLLQRLRSQ